TFARAAVCSAALCGLARSSRRTAFATGRTAVLLTRATTRWLRGSAAQAETRRPAAATAATAIRIAQVPAGVRRLRVEIAAGSDERREHEPGKSVAHPHRKPARA